MGAASDDRSPATRPSRYSSRKFPMPPRIPPWRPPGPAPQATGWDAVRDWLGWGLVSQEDAARHAAVRDVLAPAFRAASVRGFEPLFTEVWPPHSERQGRAHLATSGPRRCLLAAPGALQTPLGGAALPAPLAPPPASRPPRAWGTRTRPRPAAPRPPGRRCYGGGAAGAGRGGGTRRGRGRARRLPPRDTRRHRPRRVWVRLWHAALGGGRGDRRRGRGGGGCCR
jgi:hypothetical protein